MVFGKVEIVFLKNLLYLSCLSVLCSVCVIWLIWLKIIFCLGYFLLEVFLRWIVCVFVDILLNKVWRLLLLELVGVDVVIGVIIGGIIVVGVGVGV